MPDLTLSELARIIRECAGEEENAGFNGDFAGTSFEDLGYDSLAVLETTARLKQDYSVDLTDDEITVLDTPARLLELARQQLSAAS